MFQLPGIISTTLCIPVSINQSINQYNSITPCYEKYMEIEILYQLYFVELNYREGLMDGRTSELHAF